MCLRGVQDDIGEATKFYIADMALVGDQSGDIYIAGYVYGHGKYAGRHLLLLGLLTGIVIFRVSLHGVFAGECVFRYRILLRDSTVGAV